MLKALIRMRVRRFGPFELPVVVSFLDFTSVCYVERQ